MALRQCGHLSFMIIVIIHSNSSSSALSIYPIILCESPPESEMSVFESNIDFFVCRLVVYSSIAYGLLRDGVVCSGLLRETGRPGLFYRRFMFRGS
jgi:hypothetical protein